MTINEILIKEMSARSWWNNTNINQSTARRFKQLAKENKLSYEKSCEIIKKLGYYKIQDEIWKKNKM